ncbi:MAG: DUF1634 domain-containing protein [Candidatus Rokubacteria bacterium]|nr:DUF1634 domain-containing protein [Candidatus Rokubacteria bacterium]
MTGGRFTDEQVDQLLGRLLLAGVLLSATVVLLGGLVYLARHGSEVHDYRVFRGEPPALERVTAVARGAAAGDGRAIMQLGILILLATPVARVALSVVAFIRQRDPTYVIVTCVVLAVLLSSMLGSRPP